MKQYLIVGTSAAGIAAAAKLRQLDAAASVTCITQESEFTYNKCFLADYLAGFKALEQLRIKPADFFSVNNIKLVTDCTITKLDPHNKRVISQTGQQYSYNKLLLAVGGSVVTPEIDGIKDCQGIFQFYTLQDTQEILDFAQKETTQNIVIIGAGLSGLECADAVKQYFNTVTVIEKEQQVLPALLPQDAAHFLQQKMKNAGVGACFGVTVQKIIKENNKLKAVQLSDGRILKADMVICALGARPNGWLAQEAGLQVDRGAVVVNQYLQSSDSSIYAAGDVAQVTHKLTGQKIKSCLWPDALQQGITAAINMTGTQKKYDGSVPIISSAFFGVKFFACGNKEQFMSDNAQLCQETGQYQNVMLRDGIVVGFVVIGANTGIMQLKRSLLTQAPLE